MTKADTAAPPPAEVQSISWSSARRGVVADLGWLFLGRFTLVGANAATMLLLAHYLSLDTYGLFATVVSAQLLVSRFVLMGVGSGMLRLRALPELRHRSPEVVQAGLQVLRRTAAAVLLAAFAVVALGSLAPLPWPAWAVLSVAAGAIGVALVDYSFYYRRSQLEFRSAALLQGGTAVVRSGLTVSALWMAAASPPLLFLTYAGTSVCSGVAQTLLLARQCSLPPEQSLVRRLVQYSLWTGSADVIAAVALHQGVFLLTLLGQSASAGLFGLGMTLAQGFLLINTALNDYVTPRAVQVSSLKSLQSFQKQVFTGAVALALACLPLMAAVGALAPRLLRPELHAVVPIFYCLSVSLLIGIIQAPVTATGHYLQRPQLLMAALVVRVLFTSAMGLALVPRWGAAGMAAAHLGGTALGAGARTALVGMALRAASREQPG